ncbi:MAG: hypothetical protein M1817_000629 [Caeruleum heppii]|nr:MAG: hypothetical protein M1817_000629 [Caeruleum heppii]
MSSLFHRKRAVSNPQLNANPNPSATTAAAQAFLASRASNASLSSAAAAAALRSHTTSPVPIGNLQTRRTMRRQGSTASNASMGSARGGARGLQRTSSSGSMTERSFRTPSPNGGSVRVADNNAPPVPPLPQELPASKTHRRTASLEPPVRVVSPPPNKTSGRGVSLDRGGGMATGRAAAMRLSALPSVQEAAPQRSGPSQRPQSPLSPASPRSNGLATVAPVRGPDGSLVLQPQPIKKKKKKTMSQGSIESIPSSEAPLPIQPQARPKPTTVAPPALSLQPDSRPVNATGPEEPAAKPKKKKKKVLPPVTTTQQTAVPSLRSPPASMQGSDLESIAESEDDNPTTSTRPLQTRAAQLLTKQPSIVREEPEAESEQATAPQPVVQPGPKKKKKKKSAAATAGLVASQTPTEANRPTVAPAPDATQAVEKAKKVAIANASKRYAESRQHDRASSQPPQSTPGTLTPGQFGPDDQVSSLGSGSGSLRASRHQSLSPSRYAHFATNASPGVMKHQPPPRSLSPAKSAMKQTPSPRTGSPAGANGVNRTSGHSPSETSEMSMLSEDRSLERRRSVRVSFDDSPVVLANDASPPATPTTPQSVIQSRREARRSWFGFGKGKKGDDGSMRPDEEDDDILKPRPALPSFGSVRKGQPRDESDRSSPAERRASEDPGASNDHVVGNVLAQDFASRGTPSKNQQDQAPSTDAPLPPRVTSVEGTGSVSDDLDTDGSTYSSEATDQKANVDGDAAQAHAKPLQTSTASTETESEPSGQDEPSQADIALPSIELVEPTPTLEQSDRKDWFGGSGTTSGSEELSSSDEEEVPSKPAEHHAPEPTPASVGIAEPEPPESATNHTPGVPAVGEVALGIRQQTEGLPVEHIEHDSDNASVYSDAAEELSEPEGDGFLSLDAVVESPVVDAAPGLLGTPPASPLARLPKDGSPPWGKARGQTNDPSQPEPEEGWDKAQAYWSGLSEQRRQELEQAATPKSTKEAAHPTTPQVESKKKKKKKIPLGAALPDTIGSVAEQSNHDASIPSLRVNTAPTTKQSTATVTAKAKTGNADAVKRIPKSMRDGTNKAPNGTMPHDAAPTITSNAAKKAAVRSRPMSEPNLAGPSPASAGVNKPARSMAAAPAAPAQPAKKKVGRSKLSRTLSNASDSDASVSSFKKARPVSSAGEGFSMRRTMRGASTEPQSRRVGSPDGNARSGRFSMRSLSPAGRKPFNTPPSGGAFGRGTMRTSMRGSVDSGTASLRSNPAESTKSPSRFPGFGKKKKKAAAAKPAGRFGSRFADSSDEDDSGPRFRSRISDSDSSDDDMYMAHGSADLTPVRGIPRRIGEEEGDSTDLPDSSDGEKAKKPKGTSKAERMLGVQPKETNNHQGTALATGSLRPRGSGMDLGKNGPSDKDKKKRSFFGALGRRKDTSKVQKAEGDSGARRDTPLERTRMEMRGVQSGSPTSPASPASAVGRPRLVKKNTSQRSINSAQWPLPPVLGQDQRPSTADGVFGAATSVGRPELGNRRTTTPTPYEMVARQTPGVATAGVMEPAAKKKKFPRLRRVFGLTD